MLYVDALLTTVLYSLDSALWVNHQQTTFPYISNMPYAPIANKLYKSDLTNW